MSHTTYSTIATQALRRVDEVIAGVECPWPAMAPELQLLVVLKQHVGKHDAISLDQLVELLGVSDRTVKLFVSNLRLHFRVMIGASRDAKAGGYYIISSAEEAKESSQFLVSQALTMLRVVRIMRGRHATAEIFGQLSIELGLTPGTEESNASST